MGTRLFGLDIWYQFDNHPHAYGDKTVCKAILALFAGSSPRVWGQVYSGGDVTTPKGIIPTRMGTSIDRYGIGCI